MASRHFLSFFDLTRAEAAEVLARASELKRLRAQNILPLLFERKVLAMIFEKSSTRTRVSFESAMIEGGGGAIFLSLQDSQLGRGEPIGDTARVLSEMCDAIIARTYAHSTVEELAAQASVPVINALTDRLHPCQVLADLQTYQEHRGGIAGRKVAWIGDGNNMCNTYIEAAQVCDFELAISTPPEFVPPIQDFVRGDANVSWNRDPQSAVTGADLVVTDVWVSMGQEASADHRRALLNPYQVDSALMSHAKTDALFMHCLPAHRGEEVTAEVIDHVNSVVWDEAGNRLHAQKALLEFLLRS
ncbi:MAG: ornithine carbamoyltransferase [Gammaproteobacteria bacterium]|nr:ornithine carbamoyltransferase [Gammaproteobacteria bacterium]